MTLTPANINLAYEFVESRVITGLPATYKMLGTFMGMHWRDRSMNSILGEVSRLSYARHSILITAMIGHQPTTKNGSILPGEGFNELAREIAGIEIRDFTKYRLHMQEVYRRGQEPAPGR